MEAKQLVFLKTPTLPARKAAVAWVHEQHLTVLAQYGTVALEVLATSAEQLAALRAAPQFAAVHEQALTEAQLAALPAEAREIGASWNQGLASASAAKGTAADSKIRLSWGTPQFDEPRPYSELSADFFARPCRLKRCILAPTRPGRVALPSCGRSRLGVSKAGSCNTCPMPRRCTTSHG